MPRYSLVIALCLCASLAHAQTRILADSEIGTASGLGYRLPSLVFGPIIEQPIGTRWEAQGSVKWSPDEKYVINSGNQLQIRAMGILWTNRWLGLSGAEAYQKEWTYAYDKTIWEPSAGLVLRDRWFGAPGRFYVDYTFPTGCVWATPSNPCALQSNRLHGIEFYQEFRFFSHWRFGFRGAWWAFCDQGNPVDPAAGRACHNTGTDAFVLRYEFKSAPTDKVY